MAEHAEHSSVHVIPLKIYYAVFATLMVLTGVTVIFLYAISLPAAWRYVTFMKVERSAYLHIPINWLYCVFIIFSVAAIGRYCVLVYKAFKGAKPPETDPAKLGD